MPLKTDFKKNNNGISSKNVNKGFSYRISTFIADAFRLLTLWWYY